MKADGRVELVLRAGSAADGARDVRFIPRQVAAKHREYLAQGGVEIK